VCIFGFFGMALACATLHDCGCGWRQHGHESRNSSGPIYCRRQPPHHRHFAINHPQHPRRATRHLKTTRPFSWPHIRTFISTHIYCGVQRRSWTKFAILNDGQCPSPKQVGGGVDLGIYRRRSLAIKSIRPPTGIFHHFCLIPPPSLLSSNPSDVSNKAHPDLDPHKRKTDMPLPFGPFVQPYLLPRFHTRPSPPNSDMRIYI
jgi:hypothetical protein